MIEDAASGKRRKADKKPEILNLEQYREKIISEAANEWASIFVGYGSAEEVFDSNDRAEELILKMSITLNEINDLVLRSLNDYQGNEYLNDLHFGGYRVHSKQLCTDLSKMATLLIYKCRSDEMKANIRMHANDVIVKTRDMMYRKDDYKRNFNLGHFDIAVTGCHNYLDTLKTKHLSEFR